MSTATGIQVAVLGPLVVRGPQGDPVDLPGARVGSLVIRLVLAHRRPVSAERLIDDLWGAAPPARPLNALQALVSRLRRLAPALPITSGPSGYALDVPGDAVDLWRFEELARRGHTELAAEPELAARTLREALELWRGEEFSEAAGALFVQAAAARVTELRRTVLGDRIDADLALGCGAEIVPELEQLAASAPIDELCHARLMRALHAAGRKAEALDVYARVRGRLSHELGLDPSPDLERAHLAVLREEPAVVAAVQPAAVSRPTAARARRTGTMRSVAPMRLTRVLGRAAELSELSQLLVEARLVTLIGPGGVGKTRLGVEAAQTLTNRFEDGVWWVALAAVEDPARVPETVLAALAASSPAVLGAAEVPVATPYERLIDAVGDRELLLVLDNCEHVIDAVAELADELFQWCPGVRILATSREPLATDGEQLLSVRPLPLPPVKATLHQVRDSPAVQLLTERTRAVRSSFQVDEGNAADVARICRRLDGLPLALELAAARLRALSPAEVAERLDDHFRILSSDLRGRPERHRTLHAAVGWSWGLLRLEERVLARRLAVFSGGATLRAVEEICTDPGVGVVPRNVVDLLTALVDKSLVQLDESGPQARYHTLETVRGYLAERLDDEGEEAALRATHARHFAQLAETAEQRLIGVDQALWLGRVAADHDNLQAALRWSLAAGEGALAIRLVAALGRYWSLCGQQIEAADWADRALAVPGEDAPADARAIVMIMSALAPTASPQGMADALASIRSWLDLAEQSCSPGTEERPELTAFRGMLSVLDQDPDGALDAMAQLTRAPHAWVRSCGHLNCGHLYSARRDGPRAIWHFRAALRESRSIGERWGQIQALSALADIAASTAGPSEAIELLEDALRLAAELGALEDQVLLRARLGSVLAGSGDLPGARALLETGLRTARQSGVTRCLPHIRGAFAEIARWQRDLPVAAACLARSIAALRAAPRPDVGQLALLLCGLGHVEVARDHLGLAGDHCEEALSHSLLLGDARVAGRVALLAADIAAARGEAERAMRLLGVTAGTAALAAGHLDMTRIRERCAMVLSDTELTAAHQWGISCAAETTLAGVFAAIRRT
ncbi:AfsR/SARP family transcriptional regulator [Kitasatospora sp. NBC_01250]|uniref:BTAD domain-containing putative transcriptional regulator n=1 Tax=Kitasatospora sp. NBC_01250 TaxID=2903571 RepID=UPI002E33E9B8|nr:BTAD domain-containing putative transcriptional regulator [Kitasatospora sp. NBC_01250]